MKRELSFPAACVFELSLLVLVFLWARAFDAVPLAGVRWSGRDLLIGIAAAVPPFLFFIWTLRSDVAGLARHRELMNELFRPMFARWRVHEFAIVSLIAGGAEEALFRGAIQGSLSERVGVAWAIALASAAFGAAHLVTWTYAIIAALIGAYLGWLWVATGNLLTPVATHAAYDFAALTFLVYARPKE